MRSIEKVLFSMTMHQFTSRLTTWKEQSFESSDSRNSLCTLESNVSKRTITAKFEACAAPRRSIRSLVPPEIFMTFKMLGATKKGENEVVDSRGLWNVFRAKIEFLSSVREMISDLVFYITGKGSVRKGGIKSEWPCCFCQCHSRFLSFRDFFSLSLAKWSGH